MHVALALHVLEVSSRTSYNPARMKPPWLMRSAATNYTNDFVSRCGVHASISPDQDVVHDGVSCGFAEEDPVGWVGLIATY